MLVGVVQSDADRRCPIVIRSIDEMSRGLEMLWVCRINGGWMCKKPWDEEYITL